MQEVKKLSADASSAPVCISAHQSELAALALNLHGTLLATGSQLGTLVRVWDTRYLTRQAYDQT